MFTSIMDLAKFIVTDMSNIANLTVYFFFHQSRGSLMLRNSALHFPTNFGDIAFETCVAYLTPDLRNENIKIKNLN